MRLYGGGLANIIIHLFGGIMDDYKIMGGLMLRVPLEFIALISLNNTFSFPFHNCFQMSCCHFSAA